MTQSTFFAVYLLDSGCPARLDGKDRTPQSPEFTSQERALVWDGIEHLFADGRMKLIVPVKREMEWLYPQGLARLEVYDGHRLVLSKRARRNVLLYQEIVTKYPCIAPRPSKHDADPWLIVAAKRFGYSIVTTELHKNDRAPKQHAGLRLPDICEAEGIPWFYLRKLAYEEGWLSKP